MQVIFHRLCWGCSCYCCCCFQRCSGCCCCCCFCCLLLLQVDAPQSASSESGAAHDTFHTINNTTTSPPPRSPFDVGPSSIYQRYTRQTCVLECKLRLAHASCNCTPWDLPKAVAGTGGKISVCDHQGTSCFQVLELNLRCRTLHAVHSLSGSHERKVEMRLPGRLRHGLLRRAGGGGSPGRRGPLPQSSDPAIKEV